MNMHQGHRALILAVWDKGDDLFLFPDTASRETLDDLYSAGLVGATAGLSDGNTYVNLTPDGRKLAAVLDREREARNKSDAARRTAKERALHKMGQAIQALTEHDTPSDKMLDQAIERLVAGLEELSNVRKP